MSYAEPIAIRAAGVLYVTDARFSMTTSHHRSYVAGGYAVEHGADRVKDVPHQTIRAMARERGVRPGPWGAQFD
jgi:hypothetical protein